MGTFIQLFSVLDGWDPEHVPEGIRLSPDAAIASARETLSGKGDPRDALRLITDEIRRVCPVLRLVEFDEIDKVKSTPGWDPAKTRRLACELHQLAARLSMCLRDFDAARNHLVSAAACNSRDPDPIFRLVEVYFETGSYIDAFALLEQTFDRMTTGSPDAALQLYRLARDVFSVGATADAKSCLKKIIERQDAGNLGTIAHRCLAKIDLGQFRDLSNEELERMYLAAGQLVTAGRRAEALQNFLELISQNPQHATSWFFIGLIYFVGPTTDTEIAEGVLSIRDRQLSAERWQELQFAVQALEITTRLEPSFAEAHNLLNGCYLLLGMPGPAVQSGQTAARLDPKNPQVLANLSQAFLLAGQPLEAFDAAQSALEIEPKNSAATLTLAILSSLATNDEPNQSD